MTMTAENRLALRAAIRIQGHLLRRRTDPGGLASQWEYLSQSLDDCQRKVRHLTIARERDWQTVTDALTSDLAYALDNCQNRLTSLTRLLRRANPKTPSVRDIRDELVALAGEFDDVRWDLRNQRVSITTPPIVLEGIELGPFSVRLDWRRLGEPSPYRVIALDPHPAAGNDEVTHPHVSSQILCEGDAKAAIARALEDGRLYDFFSLVSRVLQTYNASSPHVALARWFGHVCEDCGAETGEDDLYRCNGCDHRLCNDCLSTCPDCETSNCSECSTICPRCELEICESCLGRCSKCTAKACVQCLTNNLCEDCHAPDTENDDAGTSASETPTEAGVLAAGDGDSIRADVAVQSARLGKVAVPA